MREGEENTEPDSGHFETLLAVEYSEGTQKAVRNSSKTLAGMTRIEV